ncbi:hypothetical protein HK405_012755, partial [Cladochytrium tenue]
TTSGLLSFTFFHLGQRPNILRKAQAEVDRVTEGQPITLAHIAKLTYVDAVLKESLRLYPTAPAFGRATKDGKGFDLPNGYRLDDGEVVLVSLFHLHRDPKVWAEPEVFKPERFLDGEYEKLPPNCYKPFGTGERACIGRAFAIQEAMLVTAMILQRFDIELSDPSLPLQIKQTLTIKPDGVHMRSCELFSQRLASESLQRGYIPSVVTLDSIGFQRLPKDQPVIVITASYEGQPCDNAKLFITDLEAAKPGDATGVSYAVLGCGHKDWARTYQRIPSLVDKLLSDAGATRLAPLGKADAAGDFFGDFEAWEDTLWAPLTSYYGGDPAADKVGSAGEAGTSDLQVEVVSETRFIGGESGYRTGVVVSNTRLTADELKLGGLEKRHVELRLPDGMTYRSGDYLAIMPTNPASEVQRVLRRFGIAPEATLLLRPAAAGAYSHLPSNAPVAASTLLANYVEVGEYCSRRTLVELAATATDSAQAAALRSLAEDPTYATEVVAKRLTLLDILEQHATHPLPLARFLALLPAMRMRQYSISSSPLWNPAAVTLTFDVLDAPALSAAAAAPAGDGSSSTSSRRRKVGVASTFLARCAPGDRVACAVRASPAAFHLPADPAVPVVMVAAGSGVAPFRGFVQERAAMAAAGRKVGRALLYYGCRGREEFAHGPELQR